jgi:hypothetical protein
MKKGYSYRNIIFLIALVTGICFDRAYGQTEKYLLPTEIKEQTIITQPATLQKGFFRTGMMFTHSFADKIFNEKNEKISPFESFTVLTRSITLVSQYGLTDRLQINLRVPYISNKFNSSSIEEWPGVDSIVSYHWQQDAKGIGDIELEIFYQVLTEKQLRPSVTLRTNFRFNTGVKDITNIKDEYNYDAPPGTGEPRLSVDVHFRKVFYPYSFTFTAGYDYYFGGKKVIYPFVDELSFRTGNNLIFMGSANFHVNEWIALVNDFIYFYGWEDKIAGETIILKKWAFIYQPYLYFQIKRFRLVQSVQIPLKGCAYTADPRYILILQYQF